MPLLTSAVVAGAANAAALFCAAAILSAFLLRGSIEAPGAGARPVKLRREALLAPAHLALLVCAAVSCAALLAFYRRFELLPLGAFAAAVFFLQRRLLAANSEEMREKRSLAAELLGVLLLSLAAPAAWIASRGRLDREGSTLWLLNLLFFLGGVLYVKYRVRGLLVKQKFARFTERVQFAWPVIAYHAMVAALVVGLVVLHSLPLAVLVAFAPGLMRAAALPGFLGQRFPIRRLGWTEMALSLYFGTLLVMAWW